MYIVSPDVTYRDLGEETVLLNLATGRYFGLDDVGTRMWTCIVETQSLEKTLEILIEEYDATPEQLRTDLADFVRQLESLQLLTATNG